MATKTAATRDAMTVSVLAARSNFGKLLDQIEERRRGVVIEKRGVPKAVILSLREYVKLAAPEPDILRMIGEHSVQRGTDKLTSRQIQAEIKKARAERKRA